MMAIQPDNTSANSLQPVRTGQCQNEKSANEKQAENDLSGSTVNESSPILYLYLSFESPLPTPSTLDVLTTHSGKSLPPCPNLRPYASPRQWSYARKSVLLVLSSVATLITAYSAGAYSPPSKLMAEDFHTSHTAVTVGITTFCIGFGSVPMLLAPLSEVWGRYPIFVAAGIVFVIFQAVCSVVSNVAGMIVCRFFVGAGASVFSAVVGGVIADLWGKEDRNTPMALYSASVLLGTSIGPLVSAVFVNSVKNPTRAWQWTFWHQVIMDVVIVALIIVFFSESRASVLLTRKARALNDWYQKLEKAGVFGVWISLQNVHVASASKATLRHPSDDRYQEQDQPSPALQLYRIRWVIEADELRPSVKDIMVTSLKRPFSLLFTEPVVFCFSLWAAFAWGILYLSFSVISYLYNNNLDMTSRVYISMIVATITATFAGILQDQLLKLPAWKSPEAGGYPTSSRFWHFMRLKFPADSPESRLYFACITAMFLPAGLFIAFLSPDSWKDYAQAIGFGFALWGIYSVYLATFNYLVDAYHVYASSALAAQSLCRNLLGGVFAIIATPLFHNLGTRGAGGLLGGVAAALTVIPWILAFYGPRIRARSKIALILQKT